MGLFNKNKKEEEIHGDIKTPALPIKPRNKKSDDHLYTEIISRSDDTGLMILISYSEEYFYDMIEFISAINATHLNIVTAHSTYEEPTDQTDKYGDPITISHDRYYALISGYYCDYADIFNKISNLSNTVLESITQDLYEVADRNVFLALIDNGILEDTFAENKEIPAVDSQYQYKDIVSNNDNSNPRFTVTWPCISNIVKKIPNAFNLYDLMQIIVVRIETVHYYGSYTFNITNPIGVFDLCIGEQKILKIFESPAMDYFKDLFTELLKHEPTMEDYIALQKPRYMYDDDIEDDGMSDQEIDDIFKEKYEKFSGIADKNIKYEAIDEIVGAEDEG